MSGAAKHCIAHLVPNSGPNVYYQAFWEYLPRDRYEVDYISFEPPGALHDWARQRGAVAESLHAGTGTRAAPYAFVQLLRLLRRRPYDLVHLHGFCALASGLPAARCLGVKCVVYNHYYGRELLLYKGNWVSRWIDRTFSPRVDHLIAVSRDLEEYALGDLKMPRERVSLIHFGFDFPAGRLSAEDRAKLRQRAGLSPEDFVVGCVARLHWTKGQADLLEALASAGARAARPLRAVFLGEGPDREKLEQRANSLGIGSRVRFLGWQPDVWTWYQLMDVLVHPSRQRAYEQVIPESMAMGTPVVATPIGAAREMFVHGQNGWLVPEQDPAAIAQALEDLSRTPLSPIGRAAADTVQSQLGSRQDMVAAYDRLYQKLLAG